jgi:hypothetical protein
MQHRFRNVTSYVTQMSLVKNCPSHIKGAYAVHDVISFVLEQDDGAVDVAE